MSCCVVGDFLVNTGLFHPLFENLIGGRTGRKFRENKRIVIFIRFPLRQPLDGILRERCINGSGCLLLHGGNHISAVITYNVFPTECFHITQAKSAITRKQIRLLHRHVTTFGSNEKFHFLDGKELAFRFRFLYTLRSRELHERIFAQPLRSDCGIQGNGELGDIGHDRSLFKRLSLPAFIGMLQPVNEA